MPQDQLSGFCSEPAQRIAGFPANGIAHIKAVEDKLSAADEAALVGESQRFVPGMQAPATVERVRWMLVRGGQTDGDLERNLGAALARYPR